MKTISMILITAFITIISSCSDSKDDLSTTNSLNKTVWERYNDVITDKFQYRLTIYFYETTFKYVDTEIRSGKEYTRTITGKYTYNPPLIKFFYDKEFERVSETEGIFEVENNAIKANIIEEVTYKRIR